MHKRKDRDVALVPLPDWIAPVRLHHMPYWLPHLNDEQREQQAIQEGWRNYMPGQWDLHVCHIKFHQLAHAMEQGHIQTGLESIPSVVTDDDNDSFGHFAVSQMLGQRHARMQSAPCSHPPPRKIREIARLLLRQQQESRQPQMTPDETAERQPSVDNVTTTSTTQKHLTSFAKPSRNHVRQTEIARVMALDTVPVYPILKPGIPGLSLNDIKCNKYIVQHARGLTLETVLPTGHMVAWFAVHHVYETHRRHQDCRQFRREREYLAKMAKRARPSQSQRRRMHQETMASGLAAPEIATNSSIASM
jgi:hypothetical protein